jgi:hypothetical protein
MVKNKYKRHAHDWNDVWWKSCPLIPEELIQRLNPLLRQIRRVDEIVERVAVGKGRISDLVNLERILREPLTISEANRTSITLAQPTEVRYALSSLSDEIHLEVHALDGRYPCYLLCRISTGWDMPDTVVDELYVSSRNDFFLDERFTVLLRNGRSRTFLRLSPFRKKLKEWFAKTSAEPPDERTCDEVIEAIASLVLAAAWYEDQRLPFIVADIFELRNFRSALELVAFILGSDLYQVATGIRDGNECVIDFFKHVYENPPLATLLDRLNRYGPEKLAALEDNAQKGFTELNRAFSTFLSTTDMFRELEHIELYKVVLGCFGNLHAVASKEYWTPALERRMSRLSLKID